MQYDKYVVCGYHFIFVLEYSKVMQCKIVIVIMLFISDHVDSIALIKKTRVNDSVKIIFLFYIKISNMFVN